MLAVVNPLQLSYLKLIFFFSILYQLHDLLLISDSQYLSRRLRPFVRFRSALVNPGPSEMSASERRFKSADDAVDDKLSKCR